MTEGTAGRQIDPAEAAWPALPHGCDPREIAHFNAQAEQDEGESARRWLHRYNPLRLAFVDAMARQAGLTFASAGLAGQGILDVGCGTGIFCQALAGTGARVHGIDPATSAIRLARHEAPAGLDLRYDAGVVGDDRQSYDIVTAMEVIEHVPDPGGFLRQCGERVRPGGILAVSTINRTLQSYLYAIVMAEKVLGLLPRGAHEWRRFVQPSEVEAAFPSGRFRTLACWGATMNLRTRLMQRASGLGVNYIMALQRLD